MVNEALTIKIIFRDGEDDILNLVEDNGKFYLKPLFMMLKEVPESIYNSIYNDYLLSTERDDDLNKIITTELNYDEFFDKSWNPFEKCTYAENNRLIIKYFR